MGKHYQEAKNSFKPIPKYNPKYEKKKAAAESFKKALRLAKLRLTKEFL